MLNERIKTLRIAKGLTMQAVADVFGISRGSVASWESGINQPDPRKLEKLAEIFNSSVDYLITGNSKSDHEGLNSLGLLVPFVEWSSIGHRLAHKPKDFVPAWYSEPSEKAFATRLIVEPDINWSPGPIPAGAIIIIDPLIDIKQGVFILTFDKKKSLAVAQVTSTRGETVALLSNSRSSIQINSSTEVVGVLTEWRLGEKLI